MGLFLKPFKKLAARVLNITLKYKNPISAQQGLWKQRVSRHFLDCGCPT